MATATPTPEPIAAIAQPSPPQTGPQLCLVTREQGVSADYVPPDLVALSRSPSVGPAVQMRRTAAEALQQLLAAAQSERVYLTAISGYRSYAQQQEVLQAEVTQYGADRAQREVAPPGHSEHQLGVAVDVLATRDTTDLTDSFGSTPEGIWLAQHAPLYGFVISYPAGPRNEAITGYVYEPWHIRYVGLPLATAITAAGQTTTEYLPAHGLAGCNNPVVP